ncbi:MAG: sulfide/dihydroorotate dehydrogenase-like FAD/NAD-binding protein [Bifidobacteriaceae bacterium]|jgi:ferredoxin--NADP+ reductase|nr:sulfide/dihydroorotate dehydrogenase-like FAD/NAD-binding protein [Bifidobacteriaceae bacterium]
MYKVLEVEHLNPTVTRLKVEAPEVARKALPGQFVIVRTDEAGERIPLTISNYDRGLGHIEIIFQIVGSETFLLDRKKPGDYLSDIAGPLGIASETQGKNKVAVVGGGVGCAIALPVARQFAQDGAVVHSIVGFRTRDLVILEDEFKDFSAEFRMMTDDGSYGQKGLVTNALEELICAGHQYDEVFAVGPVIMMKFVAQLTKQYKVKTKVSMNPIMVDGTGMCGACRVQVGSETKFACVHGPDFDGHLIDYDLLMRRNTQYRDKEQANVQEVGMVCNA